MLIHFFDSIHEPAINKFYPIFVAGPPRAHALRRLTGFGRVEARKIRELTVLGEISDVADHHLTHFHGSGFERVDRLRKIAIRIPTNIELGPTGNEAFIGVPPS